MTEYFLERLEVTGKIYGHYNYAIEPEKINVLKDGQKRLVYEAGYFIDPDGHKALFNQGRIVNGIWLCESCANTQ